MPHLPVRVLHGGAVLSYLLTGSGFLAAVILSAARSTVLTKPPFCFVFPVFFNYSKCHFPAVFFLLISDEIIGGDLPMFLIINYPPPLWE